MDEACAVFDLMPFDICGVAVNDPGAWIQNINLAQDGPCSDRSLLFS